MPRGTKKLHVKEERSERSPRVVCRHVVASFERACTICHKRLGNAVLVAYPDNALAHYSCYKRSQTPNGAAKQQMPTAVYDISF